MKLTPKILRFAFIFIVTPSLGYADSAHSNAHSSPALSAVTNLHSLSNVYNELLNLVANQNIEIFGTRIVARSDSQFIKIISSEYVTLAVLKGELRFDEKRARAGEAIIFPISSNQIDVLEFDASRLLATIEPDWLAQARPNLLAIERAQRRRKFWGLLEPTGVNASAPLPVQIETIRQSYLSPPAIIELRRKSFGNALLLQSLTVQKFKQAVAESDVETIAALIDPLPFTDSNDNSAIWQASRRNFATNLARDNAMKAAFIAGNLRQDPLLEFFFVGPEGGSYRIITVNRDSATFIAAVEPAQ